jgi:dTDP-glucose 4,6-dehydratase
MRILITGGAGFQGSHLAEKWLKDGHTITLMNTYSEESLRNVSHIAKDVPIVWGSVTDGEIVEKTVRGHDLVVHMAAHVNVDESLATPRNVLEVNAIGTMNVLEAVRRSGSKMIYSSSCEVYGYTQELPVTEEFGLSPHSPYAASKAAADRMCFAFYKSYGLDVTIVRPCNIYGERQRAGKGGAVIPIFVSSALAEMPLKIFGDGSQRREYMHVSDLVDAYDLVARSSNLSGVTLNVGTGETPSIREIAEFVVDKMSATIVYEQPRPGEVLGFCLDASRVLSLGFSPKIDFWEGLLSYIEWSRMTGSART